MSKTTHDESHSHHDHDEHEHPTGVTEYVRIALMGVVVLASLSGWWKGFMDRDWVTLVATLIGGFPIYREAWENIRKRRMTMELSMTLALFCALAIGQILTAAVIVFFVLFAEILEGYTVGTGRRAIEKLINALPRKVTVRRDGQEVEVDTDDVAAGETLIIRPGERVPADGVITKGSSHLDQASITGEALPVEKMPGNKVFAGTINKDGVLEISVERIGRDTTFGKIIDIVEKAEKSRAPAQRLADKLAAGLVYFALAAAIVTYIVTRDITSTISVIIVAGACGVAAGTPLAILAGIGSAARRGIIIKGGLYLEQLSTIDTVVLDKTGTLTLGVPQVATIKTSPGVSENDVLLTAAIAEQHSEHPLGEAIIRRAREQNLPLRAYASIQYTPGKGISCRDGESEILVGSPALFSEHGIAVPDDFAELIAQQSAEGNTTVLVGRDGKILGALTLSDQLRAEAKAAISELKRRGYRTLLLTGDGSKAAARVGQTLGVDEAIGDLLPQQKLDKVRELLAAGRKVAMVGDGVNDAPALAESTVGVAMGQGTDVALETADVTLMTSDLTRLVEALNIGKRCRRIIMFNFWGTILVDSAGILLAFLGMLTPIIAALIHVISELVFILNSTRLFRHRPPRIGQ